MSYVKVVLPRVFNASTGELKPGAKRIAVNDKVLVVGEDGQEVDISHLVMAWSTGGKVGEIATLKLEIAGFELERDDAIELALARLGQDETR